MNGLKTEKVFKQKIAFSEKPKSTNKSLIGIESRLGGSAAEKFTKP